MAGKLNPGKVDSLLLQKVRKKDTNLYLMERDGTAVQGGGVMGIRGELFSSKMMTEKRTYFFNIKENRYGDLFLNLVESKKNSSDGFERQSLIVFEEDLQQFVSEFQKSLDFIKKHKSAKPKR